MAFVPHRIGAAARESGDGRTFQSLDPASEEVLAHVALAGDAEVDAAVTAAWEAYHGGWRVTAPSRRAALLRELAHVFEANLDEIAETESLDTGKPLIAARGEIAAAVEMLRYYATLPENVRGVTFADEPGFATSSHRVPYGVVAAIAPWNFPFYFAIAKTAPALACGNAVVLKAAEQTPLSADLFGRLSLEAGLAPGVVNVVHGGPETGAALVSHPGVPAITFTGSTEVGRSILRAAAERVALCHLELGGKTPFIVLDDADLERAADAAAAQAFYNAGQVCTAASRLLVAEPVLDRFVELLVERAQRLRVGDPTDPQTDVGPLISDEQRRRVTRYVDGAIEQGARMRAGGSSAPQARGYFFQPTVLDAVRPSMAVARDEVFGPVTAIISVADEAEAVAVANDSQYGLSASIWTERIDRAMAMADRLEVGVLSVNTGGRDPSHAPYEGHKQSGIGEDKGLEAIGTFTQLRLTTIAYRQG